MKSHALRTLPLLTLLLMLTTISTSAQSQRSGVLNIPFSFTVGEKTLPAGEYTVEPNRKDYDKVWLVQSKDNHTSVLVITMSVRAKETQEQTKLVFHRLGEQYFLSQIWTPGGSTGRELTIPGAERELAKNAKNRRTIVVLAR
ncbi:MAG TPA: hypothetical protein VIV66_12705 [Pyrinomonadaceae bacterium]